MVNAKIIENKPRCGICGGDSLSKVRDCKMAFQGGQPLTLFMKNCLVCDINNGYLADVCMDDTTRIEITEELRFEEE